MSRRQDHDIHRGRRGRPQHDPNQGPRLVQREYQRLQAEVYLFIHTIVGLSMRTSTPTLLCWASPLAPSSSCSSKYNQSYSNVITLANIPRL